MKYKAAIFDLDGTLLDTIEDLGNSMNTVLERNGFPMHEIEKYKYFVGDGVENLVERALPAKKCDKMMIKKIIEEYRKEYGARWAEKTKPYPGILELLKNLEKREIKINILSNKPDDTTKIVVNKFFQDVNFNYIFGARDGIPVKPNPGLALEIASLLNLQPEEFLYIGDTDTDMKTANSAGMFSVGVLWGFRTAGELLSNGARKLISQPSELLKLIDK